MEIRDCMKQNVFSISATATNRLCCTIHRFDYWRRGRTIDKLGIDKLSIGELTHYVTEGVLGKT
jgi:hypothetical protein